MLYNAFMNKKSFIYFVLAVELNRIKIGRTLNVHKRYADIKMYCPCTVSLLCVLRELQYARPGTGLYTEGNLHARFRDFNLHGEWFTADPSILQFIEDHRDKNLIISRPSTVSLPPLQESSKYSVSCATE